ncbi:TraR/DksA family transcriptional regulator [Actinocrinis puniceicyclus]|uniref:TraR/DksA family transcriptional regulator n=1 Tax=Actinocrinis puniceicyclus TaxID=977794 RepID=A0A8J7WNC9_9ACTN|nr:TraR/DksA family transcriptional regulator [Actinocrinis puniceicyclus]MBS2965563.1 TraR/DksA family transcriptional regulator [Actinocrinis puniceicyclus]
MSTTARNSASAASPATVPAVKKTGKKTAAKPAQRPSASGPANKVPASRGGRAASAKPKTETLPEPALVAAGAAGRGAPGALPVRPGEDPWTEAEVAEVETELRAEVDRLRADVAAADMALADLLRDASDGAGDDQADAGSKNFEREHEMSIAANARDMLVQSERALARIAAGTYGACESCGEPIGKARLQVFPRATLCVSCKQKQERRY